MSSFQATPVRRLRQQVEVQLREAIASRRLTEGDKLPSEAELAEMFSVSRSTVREALRSLDTAGLISKVPGASGGSFVRSMDYAAFGDQIAESMGMLLELGNADNEEVVVTRGMLEVPSSRLASEHRNDEDLAELRDILDRQRAAKVHDPEVPELDIDFHSTIARASGNRVLAALVYGLHRSTRPVAQMRLNEEQGHATVKQHIALYKAIEAGDADGAEAAIKIHLAYLTSVDRPQG
jgi:GntR family transcriptional repressor for pyruvate dehydrogenase complex